MRIYLAAPYSHHCHVKRVERFNAINKRAAELMAAGHVVFSPISHSHPIAEHIAPELLMDHEFWMKMDIPFVDWADELWVLQLDGWKESKGVQKEIDIATYLGKTITYLMP